MEELNLQQKEFCEEYLKGFANGEGINATRAYMAAYPNSSYDAARGSASELLSKPSIKEYLSSRIATMVMSTNEMLVRLADIARSAEKDSDKIHALELIGRTHGAFLDRSDITSGGQTISLADYLNGIVKVKESKKSNVTVVG